MKLRSISYIIAVLLITVITVGTVALLYAWQKVHQFQTQTKTGGVLATYTKEVSGDIEIISTYPDYCPRAGEELTIYFRNSGSIVLRNFTIYLNGKLISNANFSKNILLPNDVAHVTIVVDANYSECSILIMSSSGARDRVVLL